MKFRELWEATKPTKPKEKPAPYPNDMSRQLKAGRDIRPSPKNKTWAPKGKPRNISIHTLDLHPDGLATAKSAWAWDASFRHGNAKPVSVANVDGKLHVLDGYHRIVQAAKDGLTKVRAQEVE